MITRDSLVQKPDRLGQVLHELSGEMCVFSFVEGLLERILRLFAALRQRPDDCLEPAGSHNRPGPGSLSVRPIHLYCGAFGATRQRRSIGICRHSAVSRFQAGNYKGEHDGCTPT